MLINIDHKALEHACQCAGRSVHHFDRMGDDLPLRASIIAHARAIEQHEAFRQEVSDAVEKTVNAVHSDSSLIVWSQMRRFIIPKLDPLVEAMRDACGAQGIATKHTPGELTKHFRTALAARGGRIVWEGE